MNYKSRTRLGWLTGTAALLDLCVMSWHWLNDGLHAQDVPNLEATSRSDSADESFPIENEELNALSTELRKLKAKVGQLEKKINALYLRRRSRQPAVTQAGDPPPVAIKAGPSTAESAEGLAAPLYSKSPLAQFNAMAADIERRVKILHERENDREADEFAKQLKEFMELRAGGYPVSSKSPEVHMVGLYEASSDHHAIAPAKVRVTYAGGPVIIALSSYEPVAWEIEIGDDVHVDQVIVSGYYEQRVTGLPDTVPVFNVSRTNGSKAFYAYTRTDGRFSQAVNRLYELTGRSVLTHQGMYRYPGRPFVIGPESSDWRLQHLIARMVPLHQQATKKARGKARATAQKIVFEGMQVSGGDRHGHGARATWDAFTVNGPILDTHIAMPHPYKYVARDREMTQWYALNKEVVQFNPSGERPVALPIPFELPRLSWPCGLTLDAKRRRLLLSSLGGEGFLYAYDIDAKAWSLVGSMMNLDTTGLAWSEEEDCLYALSRDHGERHRFTLIRMTPDGKITKRVTIGDGLPNLGHHPRCQLISTGGKIVLLAPGQPDGEEDHFNRPADHSYVIDPESGSVEYSTRLTPQQRLLAAE